jgi:hypothetical protein
MGLRKSRAGWLRWRAVQVVPCAEKRSHTSDAVLPSQKFSYTLGLIRRLVVPKVIGIQFQPERDKY